MAKELDAGQHEARGKVRHRGGSVFAAIVVSVVLGLSVLLVVYAGLLAVTPDYFLIHSFSVSKLGLFTAFANAADSVPPLILGGLLLIAAVLLVMLLLFLARKILARGAIPDDIPPAGGGSSPAAEGGSLPYDSGYAAFDEIAAPELNREQLDDQRVDQYLKQLDAMSPEEIEDFFTH